MGRPMRLLPPPGQRIAIASDAAFTFLYPHLGSHWRAQGAELFPFSPLNDEGPALDCDFCWLPGGYPELYAGQLAAANRFRNRIRHFAQSKPVHGECGGFMVLGTSLIDAEGTRHFMTALLSHSTSFAQRKMNLGYRQARLLDDGPLGTEGSVIRGHEFHYATVINSGRDEPFAEITDGTGQPLGPSGGSAAMSAARFSTPSPRARAETLFHENADSRRTANGVDDSQRRIAGAPSGVHSEMRLRDRSSSGLPLASQRKARDRLEA